jgi:hypothetical protein
MLGCRRRKIDARLLRMSASNQTQGALRRGMHEVDDWAPGGRSVKNF